MRDPYAVLGLGRDATEADIKNAYRRLAKRFHPDLHAGDKTALARFQEIQSAHRLLKDPGLRRRFDRGEVDAQGNDRFTPFDAGMRPRPQARPEGAPRASGSSAQDHANREDLFAELLASLKRSRKTSPSEGPTRPIDTSAVVLTLDLAAAVRGGRHTLTLASGRKVAITVPAGVEDGQVLRLRNADPDAAQRGVASEIEVKVTVVSDPQFERDGHDLHWTVPITLAEALLGGKVRVPTIQGGELLVTVPPGTNTGSVLKLKGQGIARSDGTAGDAYISLEIHLPPKPDAQLVDFVRDWSQRNPYQVRS